MCYGPIQVDIGIKWSWYGKVLFWLFKLGFTLGLIRPTETNMELWAARLLGWGAVRLEVK